MDLRTSISNDLAGFAQAELGQTAKALLSTLGYESEKVAVISPNTADGFSAFLKTNGGGTLNDEKAHTTEWKSIDFLFQLTDEEITRTHGLFDNNSVDLGETRIESYLFFAIDLSEENYSRTKLAEITREVNKVFPMPAMIIFRYGNVITFSIVDRRVHKREESKDVLGKVTLIKDIRLDDPHRAHIDILADLALENLRSPKNWVELHKEWHRVLDTKELNKKFFQELANWYFWAVQWVVFPDDEEKNQEVLKATSVIRLITRLIFVWFLKEKGLVSPKLFDEEYLEEVLNFNDDSCYYKAILQNLFFATLNSEMGTRKFISEGRGGRNSQHFVHNVFRYKSEFKQPEKALAELFEPIPFLNGGLFECLDKEVEENGEKKTIRVDGFSQHKKNPLYVPDDLFFNEEDYADLSEVYDDRRKTNVKVRGLINILNSYKFTVAENTPVEEEIALDPELLGRVFENLLANYNPETKTTARKQTGSFYTPREIVNYMVDESLIAYLKQKLQTETEGFGFIAIDEDQTTMFGNEARIQQKFEMPLSQNRWSGKSSPPYEGGVADASSDGVVLSDPLEIELRKLFSYDLDGNPFNETETEILIKAIDNCKILDPACGSGAFPMGILHRLVHLLGKLDPNNEKWREWQRQKAIRETEEAYKIGDHKEREARLIEINDIFENNASDYGRKLFLIENCIYGVDIQPIAIQIAKLRFFVSLVVDERRDESKRNLGVLPLPNLETKFVAANTLIALDEKTGSEQNISFARMLITPHEEKLNEIRARHFRARTRKTKLKLREEDREARQKIATILVGEGFSTSSAERLSKWDPYDQNASAEWFDREYMFGLTSGFDIVIGNPPYIEFKKLAASEKSKLVHYSTAKGKYDLYVIFNEAGTALLKNGGALCFIQPTTFLKKDFGRALRNYLRTRCTIESIHDFADLQIFDGVTNYTGIFRFRKPAILQRAYNFPCHLYGRNLNVSIDEFEQSLSKEEPSPFKEFLRIDSSDLDGSEWNFRSNETRDLVGSLSVDCIPLGDLCSEVFQGIASGKDEVFYVTESVIDDYDLERPLLRKLLKGRDVKRYQIHWSGHYVVYPYQSDGRVIPENRLRAECPNTYRYFQDKRSLLSGRSYFDASPKLWYEIWNQRNPTNFAKVRLVTPEISGGNNFAITEEYFGNTKTYHLIAAGISPKYLLALLNSSVVDFLYKSICTPQAGGFYAYKTQFLRKLPIRMGTPEEISRVTKLVDEILGTNAQVSEFARLSREIDDEVFRIYHVSDAHRRVIEGIGGTA